MAGGKLAAIGDAIGAIQVLQLPALDGSRGGRYQGRGVLVV